MIKKNWKLLAAWLIATLFALMAGLAADAIQDSINALRNGRAIFSPLNSAYIVAFFGLSILTFRIRKQFFSFRATYHHKAPKRNHLIVFLSYIYPRSGVVDCVPDELKKKLTDNLDDDLKIMKEDKKNWSWEMPLRAINYHIHENIMKTVTVIGSTNTDSKNSLEQAHHFFNFCLRYNEIRNNVKAFYYMCKDDDGKVLWEKVAADQGALSNEKKAVDKITKKGFDFEDFTDLSRAIKHLFSEFKKMKLKESDITIDFTGGQKVTSVLAAFVTLNTRLHAQYIPTNDVEKVTSYDISLSSRRASEFDVGFE